MDTKGLLSTLQGKMVNYNLAELKNDYAPYQNSSQQIAGDDYNNLNKKFNLETLISLMENEGNFFAEPLNERYIEKYRDAINSYMEESAKGDNEFKDLIRRLNCYRTFILKIPLHPAGMSFAHGKVIKKGNQYYCTAKKFYINQENSLCRFCVAKMSEL